MWDHYKKHLSLAPNSVSPVFTAIIVLTRNEQQNTWDHKILFNLFEKRKENERFAKIAFKIHLIASSENRIRNLSNEWSEKGEKNDS